MNYEVLTNPDDAERPPYVVRGVAPKPGARTLQDIMDRLPPARRQRILDMAVVKEAEMRAALDDWLPENEGSEPD